MKRGIFTTIHTCYFKGGCFIFYIEHQLLCPQLSVIGASQFPSAYLFIERHLINAFEYDLVENSVFFCVSQLISKFKT